MVLKLNYKSWFGIEEERARERIEQKNLLLRSEGGGSRFRLIFSDSAKLECFKLNLFCIFEFSVGNGATPFNLMKFGLLSPRKHCVTSPILVMVGCPLGS